MNRASKIVLVVSLCAAALLTQGIAQAQVNPYYLYQRNQALQQNMFRQQSFTNGMARYNATTYGIPAFANTNAFVPQIYTPPFTPGFPQFLPSLKYDPTTGGPVVNPYSPTVPGYGVTNPYSPVDPAVTGAANPYNPYNPYGGYNTNGAGAVLTGSADVMRAYGQTVNAVEQSRITRELANQAKLDTRKKAFELDLYIKANTPTYTEEQERVGRITLRRIQMNSLPSEIVSGKSLNLLLRDLEKFPGKKLSLEPLTLSEDIFTRLNVTRGTYGIGILRDGGKVSIPAAVQDQMKPEQRQALEKQLQNLVKEANNDRIDSNVIKDVRTEIDRVRDELVKKANEISSFQYSDAKRFLQELQEGIRALEQGEASNQRKYQRFIEEGKGNRSVQEVADYMIKEGLHFGPATVADEGAYRAVYAMMASYDVAMNSQFGSEAKE